MCNVEQLLCNVGLDILSTLFLIMICYDLMCTFYISSPILVIELCVLLAAYASYSSSRIKRFYIIITILIIELTVPFETNIEKEHTFKTNKYATLIQDIKDKQISSELTCVEVGCRGYVSESNKIRLTTILKSLDIKPSKRQVKELTLSLSKLALLTSFVIFKCKDEPEWFEPKLIVE